MMQKKQQVQICQIAHVCGNCLCVCVQFFYFLTSVCVCVCVCVWPSSSAGVQIHVMALVKWWCHVDKRAGWIKISLINNGVGRESIAANSCVAGCQRPNKTPLEWTTLSHCRPGPVLTQQHRTNALFSYPLCAHTHTHTHTQLLTNPKWWRVAHLCSLLLNIIIYCVGDLWHSE